MSSPNYARVKKIYTPKKTPDSVQMRDTFETPKYAVDILIPYLKDIGISNIWECAVGSGKIKSVLKSAGFEVVSSDIREGNSVDFIYNFVTDESMPDIEFDAIVTNPPFSVKEFFIERAIQIGKPFAFLINSDYSMRSIDWIRKYGCKKLIPTFRINYITPNIINRINDSTGSKYSDLYEIPDNILHKFSSAQFHSMWLTYKLPLENTEVFVDLPVSYRKNNILQREV